MALSKDERVDLVLLCGREGWSQRKIADEFHLRHPNREINHSSVGRIFRKFKVTGSVLDKSRPGRNKISDEVKERVLAKVAVSPNKSIRRISMEVDVPRSTVYDILKAENVHPYKLQMLHHLTEDDPDRRMEMCEWFSNKLFVNGRFTEDLVLFSDEAMFYVNGEVNRHNVRYWSQVNPHVISPSKKQGCQKIMVWCGLWKTHVLGPFFFAENVNSDNYLNMLKNQLMPQLDALGEGLPDYFQQDGAPAHYATVVREWLSENFNHWIGRRGDVEWAPRSPDLTPMDFFFWGVLKQKVYETDIRDINHLKECIERECANIDGYFELFHRVHQNFEKRINRCIEMGGHHIEHILN